jgi:hypothetical protein
LGDIELSNNARQQAIELAIFRRALALMWEKQLDLIYEEAVGEDVRIPCLTAEDIEACSEFGSLEPLLSGEQPLSLPRSVDLIDELINELEDIEGINIWDTPNLTMPFHIVGCLLDEDEWAASDAEEVFGTFVALGQLPPTDTRQPTEDEVVVAMKRQIANAKAARHRLSAMLLNTKLFPVAKK